MGEVRLLDFQARFFVATDGSVKLHKELKKEERNEMKKKMKKGDFASGMTSGRSQMYEIILATS